MLERKQWGIFFSFFELKKIRNTCRWFKNNSNFTKRKAFTDTIFYFLNVFLNQVISYQEMVKL